MEETSPTITAPLFFIFIIFFCYICLKMFAAIIMRTYDNLRKRKQLVVEAMASIVEKEANEEKAKWINFICCKIA